MHRSKRLSSIFESIAGQTESSKHSDPREFDDKADGPVDEYDFALRSYVGVFILELRFCIAEVDTELAEHIDHLGLIRMCSLVTD